MQCPECLTPYSITDAYCPACFRPCDEDSSAVKAANKLRSRTAFAGFWGALPFGMIALLFLMGMGYRWSGESDSPNVFESPLLALALAPFAVAMTQVNGRGWVRVLSAAVPGSLLGAVLFYPCFLAGIVLVPAIANGLMLGLMTIRPSLQHGDSAGLALALLGMAPSMLYLFLLIRVILMGLA